MIICIDLIYKILMTVIVWKNFCICWTVYTLQNETSQKWLMLQRGWIKFFLAKNIALNLMPTISTRCAFSYIAIWMRKPHDKYPNLLQMAPEKSTLPILSKNKSLANTIETFRFPPNDDSYNLHLKSLDHCRGETSGVWNEEFILCPVQSLPP